MDDVVFLIIAAIWFGTITSIAYYRPKLLCRFFGVEPTEKYLRRIRGIDAIGVVSLIGISAVAIGKLLL